MQNYDTLTRSFVGVAAIVCYVDDNTLLLHEQPTLNGSETGNSSIEEQRWKIRLFAT